MAFDWNLEKGFWSQPRKNVLKSINNYSFTRKLNLICANRYLQISILSFLTLLLMLLMFLLRTSF